MATRLLAEASLKTGLIIAATNGHLHLVDKPVCLTYQCCCVCNDCKARATQPKQNTVPAQPWEPKAA